MKGGEGSVEQAEFIMRILAEIRQQNAMLQSTIENLREENHRKEEEIERLRQIILNLQRAQLEERSVDLPDDEKANANGHALVCIGQEYT